MLGMRIRVGPNLSFGASCGPIEALRGDYDGDEINLHLPQGAGHPILHVLRDADHVSSELKELMSVTEQVVTGQSGTPVVKLIQDAVVVVHWLTHLQPKTHCPMELDTGVFSQIAADLPLPSTVAALHPGICVCIRA